jgi:hypothetical protein
MKYRSDHVGKGWVSTYLSKSFLPPLTTLFPTPDLQSADRIDENKS